MITPTAVRHRLSPAGTHVNSQDLVFRVAGHPGLTLEAARRITLMIGTHDRNHTRGFRGQLRRAIMRELGQDNATRALNLARHVARHARRAGIVT